MGDRRVAWRPSPALLPSCYLLRRCLNARARTCWLISCLEMLRAGRRLVPPFVWLDASKRVPTPNVIWPLSCINAIEAQGEAPRRDTTYNCAPAGRLAIAADLPVC